jgi:hypothetical protein
LNSRPGRSERAIKIGLQGIIGVSSPIKIFIKFRVGILLIESGFACQRSFSGSRGQVSTPYLHLGGVEIAAHKSKNGLSRGCSGKLVREVPLPVLQAKVISENYRTQPLPGHLQSSIQLHDLADNPKKQSAGVSRMPSHLHAHKWIARIPGTGKWRVTDRGKQIMVASFIMRRQRPAGPARIWICILRSHAVSCRRMPQPATNPPCNQYRCVKNPILIAPILGYNAPIVRMMPPAST